MLWGSWRSTSTFKCNTTSVRPNTCLLPNELHFSQTRALHLTRHQTFARTVHSTLLTGMHFAFTALGLRLLCASGVFEHGGSCVRVAMIKASLDCASVGEFSCVHRGHIRGRSVRRIDFKLVHDDVPTHFMIRSSDLSLRIIHNEQMMTDAKAT